MSKKRAPGRSLDEWMELVTLGKRDHSFEEMKNRVIIHRLQIIYRIFRIYGKSCTNFVRLHK